MNFNNTFNVLNIKNTGKSIKQTFVVYKYQSVQITLWLLSAKLHPVLPVRKNRPNDGTGYKR